jgi:hypothetical protein
MKPEYSTEWVLRTKNDLKKMTKKIRSSDFQVENQKARPESGPTRFDTQTVNPEILNLPATVERRGTKVAGQDRIWKPGLGAWGSGFGFKVLGEVSEFRVAPALQY